MNKLPCLQGCFKRVGLLGVGRSNLAVLGMLPPGVEITLRSDGRIQREDIPTDVRISRIYEGKDALSDIDEELLILSPSVRRDRPELTAALARGVIFTSDAELFFDNVRSPVLAVSGSSGAPMTYRTASGSTSVFA